MKLKKLIAVFVALFCVLTATACEARLEADKEQVIKQSETQAITTAKTQNSFVNFTEFSDFVTQDKTVLKDLTFLTLNTAIGDYSQSHIYSHTEYKYNSDQESEYVITNVPLYDEKISNKSIFMPRVDGKKPLVLLGELYAQGFEDNQEAFVYKHLLTNTDEKAVFIYQNNELVAKFFYTKLSRRVTDKYVENFLESCFVKVGDNSGEGHKVKTFTAEELKINGTLTQKFNAVNEIKQFKITNPERLNSNHLLLTNTGASEYLNGISLYNFEEKEFVRTSGVYTQKTFTDEFGVTHDEANLFNYVLTSYGLPQENAPLTYEYHLLESDYPEMLYKVILIKQGESVVANFTYHNVQKTLNYDYFVDFLQNNLQYLGD